MSSKQGSGHVSLSIQKPLWRKPHGFDSHHHKPSHLRSLPGSWELDYGGLTSRCSCRSQSSCLSPCCQPARWTGKPALPNCHACPSQLPQGVQAVLFQTYAAAGHCWPDVARIPFLPSFSLLTIPAIPTAWTRDGAGACRSFDAAHSLSWEATPRAQSWGQTWPEGLKARICGGPSTAWLLLDGLCNATCLCTQPGISCLAEWAVGVREDTFGAATALKHRGTREAWLKSSQSYYRKSSQGYYMEMTMGSPPQTSSPLLPA